MKSRKFLCFLFAIIAICVLNACGGGSGGDSNGGSGSLSLSLTDASSSDYKAVVVTIDEVQVHVRGEGNSPNDWKSLDMPISPLTVNLLELVNGVREDLGLVDLQADEVQDAAMRDIFKDVNYRVRSMAMVHEKLYQSTDLARVEFADYAQSLMRYLWRAQGAAASGIRLSSKLKPVFLPVNAAVPCGLILNELFSNALKHAFKGRSRGNITVSLDSDRQGRVHLCVGDNGIGLPPELDLQNAHSLGLRLVHMLARQLQAAVEVVNDAGTEFRITFEGHKSSPNN